MTFATTTTATTMRAIICLLAIVIMIAGAGARSTTCSGNPPLLVVNTGPAVGYPLQPVTQAATSSWCNDGKGNILGDWCGSPQCSQTGYCIAGWSYCASPGTWDNVGIGCYPCCTASTFPNGASTCPYLSAGYGSGNPVCLMTCNTGYMFVGSSDFCAASGSNTFIGACVPLTCPLPPSPANGRIICNGTKLNSNSVCDYTCNPGYAKSGSFVCQYGSYTAAAATGLPSGQSGQCVLTSIASVVTSSSVVAGTPPYYIAAGSSVTVYGSGLGLAPNVAINGAACNLTAGLQATFYTFPVLLSTVFLYLQPTANLIVTRVSSYYDTTTLGSNALQQPVGNGWVSSGEGVGAYLAVAFVDNQKHMIQVISITPRNAACDQANGFSITFDNGVTQSLTLPCAGSGTYNFSITGNNGLGQLANSFVLTVTSMCATACNVGVIQLSVYTYNYPHTAYSLLHTPTNVYYPSINWTNTFSPPKPVTTCTLTSGATASQRCNPTLSNRANVVGMYYASDRLYLTNNTGQENVVIFPTLLPSSSQLSSFSFYCTFSINSIGADGFGVAFFSAVPSTGSIGRGGPGLTFYIDTYFNVGQDSGTCCTSGYTGFINMYLDYGGTTSFGGAPPGGTNLATKTLGYGYYFNDWCTLEIVMSNYWLEVSISGSTNTNSRTIFSNIYLDPSLYPIGSASTSQWSVAVYGNTGGVSEIASVSQVVYGLVPMYYWSAVVTGWFLPPVTGSYTFFVTVDDGAQLSIDGQVVISAWIAQSPTQYNATVSLVGNQYYPILLEYIQVAGGYVCVLEFSGPAVPRQLLRSPYIVTDPPRPAGPVPTPPSSAANSNAAPWQLNFYTYADTLCPTQTGAAKSPYPCVYQSFFYTGTAAQLRWSSAGYENAGFPPLVPSFYWAFVATTYVNVPVSGAYTFTLICDDGCQISINGQTAATIWSVHTATTVQTTQTLVANTFYTVVVEFFNDGGDFKIFAQISGPATNNVAVFLGAGNYAYASPDTQFTCPASSVPASWALPYVAGNVTVNGNTVNNNGYFFANKVPCNQPSSAPANGAIVCGALTATDSSCAYSCNPGFALNGSYFCEYATYVTSGACLQCYCGLPTVGANMIAGTCSNIPATGSLQTCTPKCTAGYYAPALTSTCAAAPSPTFSTTTCTLTNSATAVQNCNVTLVTLQGTSNPPMPSFSVQPDRLLLTNLVGGEFNYAMFPTLFPLLQVSHFSLSLQFSIQSMQADGVGVAFFNTSTPRNPYLGGGGYILTNKFRGGPGLTVYVDTYYNSDGTDVGNPVPPNVDHGGYVNVYVDYGLTNLASFTLGYVYFNDWTVLEINMVNYYLSVNIFGYNSTAATSVNPESIISGLYVNPALYPVGSPSVPWYIFVSANTGGGYEIVGTNQLVFSYGNSGCPSWSAPSQSCAQCFCGVPALLPNMAMGNCSNISSAATAATCNPVCVSGYAAAASISSTCPAAIVGATSCLQWTPPSAPCVQCFCGAPVLTANMQANNCTNITATGALQQCLLQCSVGYYPSSMLPVVLTCGAVPQGSVGCTSWTVAAPTCVQCMCGSVALAANMLAGNCTSLPAAGSQQVCVPVCKAGFTTANNLPVVAACPAAPQGALTCQTWTPPSTTCVACFCGLPALTSNMLYGNCTNATTTVGTAQVCTPQCASGYAAASLFATCAAVPSGYTAVCPTWSAPSQSCIQCNCSATSYAASAGFVGQCPLAGSGAVCTLACANGYTANGSLMHTCSSVPVGSTSCAGTAWVKPGFCLPNACPVPLNQSSILYPCGATTASGGTCTPVCAPGYYQYDNTTTTTTTAAYNLSLLCFLGNWSYARATTYCKPPPVITSVQPSYVLNHVATIVTIGGLYFDDVYNISVAAVPCVILAQNYTQILCNLSLVTASTSTSLIPAEASYPVACVTLQNASVVTPGMNVYVVADLNISLAYINTNASTTPSLFLGPNATFTVGLYGHTKGIESNINVNVVVNGILTCKYLNVARFSGLASPGLMEFDFWVPFPYSTAIAGLNNLKSDASVFLNTFYIVAATASVTVSNQVFSIAAGTANASYIDPPTIQSPCPSTVKTDQPYNISVSGVNILSPSYTDGLTVCILNGVVTPPVSVSIVAVPPIIICPVYVNSNTSNISSIQLAVSNVGLTASSSNLTLQVVLGLQGSCKNQKQLSFPASDGSCICPAGTYDSVVACVQCPNGQYQSLQSQSECYQCPVYMDTGRQVGSKTSAFCQCTAGFVPVQTNVTNTTTLYGAGYSCVCPAGSYLDIEASVCKPCPADTFQSSPNILQTCSSCVSSVDAYSYTNGVTGANSTLFCVCKPGFVFDAISQRCMCPSGFYLIASQCVPCPQDTFSPYNSLNSSCLFCVGAVDPFSTTSGLTGQASAGSCTCKTSSGFVADAQTGKCMCSPGTLFTGSSCYSCPVNTYQPNATLSTSCLPCSVNTITDGATGATSSSQCICNYHVGLTLISGASCLCSPGYFYTGTSCLQCPQDTFNPIYSNATSCVTCAAGVDPFSTTNGAVGQTSAAACVCKSGFVPNGLGGCVCPPGFLFSGSSCSACPVNTYASSSSLNSSCTACDSFKTTYAGTGQVSAAACVCDAANRGFVQIGSSCYCPAGTYFDGLQCTSCLINYYSNAPTLASKSSPLCTPCDAFKITPGTGTQNASQCFCNPSLGFVEDSVSGVCMCPPGFFFTGFSCLQCPEDSYNPYLSLNTSCSPCTASVDPFSTTFGLTNQASPSSCQCKTGFVASATGQFQCVCPSGYLFSGSGCFACPLNSYMDRPSLNTTCQSCSEHMITDAVGSNSSSFCHCNQALGFVTVDGVCVCPPGSYFNGIQCIQCPANSFANTSNLAAACVSCSTVDVFKTTVSLTGQTSSNACVCPDGFVNDVETNKCLCTPGSYLAGTVCSLCGAGYYSDDFNTAASCASCRGINIITGAASLAAGYSNIYTTTSLAVGANSSQMCQCLPSFVPDNTGLCSCAPGYFFQQVSSTCQPCEVGSFSATFSVNTSLSCTSCATLLGAYSTTASSQSTSMASCMCRPTFVLDANNTCSCDRGYYFSGSSCSPCVGNSYKDEVSLADQCQLCSSLPLGTFAVSLVRQAGNSSGTCGCPELMTIGVGGKCVCGAGSYYSTQTGSCQPCAVGTYSSSTDFVTSCLSCQSVDMHSFNVSAGVVNVYVTSPQSANSSSQCACLNTFSIDSNGLCACAPGFYLDHISTSCQPCAVGAYNDDFNVNQSCSRCADLPLGQYSTTDHPGTILASDCKCLSTFIVDGDGMCNCDVGMYFTGLGCSFCVGSTYKDTVSLDSTCASCNALLLGSLAISLVSKGGSSVSSCGCPYGFVVDDAGACSCPAGSFFTGSSCYPCIVDTFKNVTSLDTSCVSCKSLPLGSYAVSLVSSGANSSDLCACPPGLLPDPVHGGACVCAPGHYYDSLQTHSCQPCPLNTYSDTYSSTGCKSCTDILGRYAITNFLGSNSTGDCLCPTGFVIDNVGSGTCVCPSGTYFVAATATTSESCQQCPSGTYSNSTNLALTCDSCKQVYGSFATSVAGSTSADNCTCPVSLVVFDQQCNCPPGEIYEPSTQLCVPCPVDTYVEGYGVDPSTRICQPCSSIPPLGSRTTAKLTMQSSPDACVCAIGYFRSGTDCIDCATVLHGAATCYGSETGDSLLLSDNLTTSGIDTSPGYWLSTNPEYRRDGNTIYTRRRQSSSGGGGGGGGAYHSNATAHSNAAWFVVERCPLRSSCPGGNGDEICADGYTGPLCGVCADGYGRLGSSCGRCPGKTSAWALAVIIIIITLMVLMVLVYVSEQYVGAEAKPDDVDVSARGEQGHERKKGFYLAFASKTVMNHLQMLTYIGDFTTVWPETFVKVFSIPGSAASATSASKNIAIDCAVRPSLQFRTVSYLLLPFILVGAVAIGYFCILWKLNQEYYARVRRGAVVVLYLAHPGIIQGLFQILACNKVGIQSFCAADMSVNCADPKYLRIRAVTIFYIVFYGFGLLLFVLVRMGKNPLEYVFLTADYKPERYFWDIWITVRKMMLVFISLYASIPLQLFFGLWLMLGSWLAHHYLEPYIYDVHRHMESVSLWVLIITTSFGSLYFNGVISTLSSSGVAVSAMLITINATFILCVLYIGYDDKKMTQLFKRLGKVTHAMRRLTLCSPAQGHNEGARSSSASTPAVEYELKTLSSPQHQSHPPPPPNQLEGDELLDRQI